MSIFYVIRPGRLRGRVAQSVYRLATGWTVRGSNPDGDEIFRTCPDRPWGPSCGVYIGYRVFPWSKERPGRGADPSLPSSAVVKQSRAIPLLPLWAVQPVQSLSACTKVAFTFIYIIHVLTTLDTQLRAVNLMFIGPCIVLIVE